MFSRWEEENGSGHESWKGYGLGHESGRGEGLGAGGICIWILGTKAGGDMNFAHEGRGIDFNQYSCL